MTNKLITILLLSVIPALVRADVTQELVGDNSGVPLHDFVVSGSQLLAVTGGGCGGGTVEEGGCPNGKSSIHSVDTADFSTTAIAAVPGANGLPGAVLIDGSLFAITGESDLGPDEGSTAQVLLRLDPATGAIEQNYGQIYYTYQDGGFQDWWCTDLALVDGRLMMGCWDSLLEITLDETDTPIASLLWNAADEGEEGQSAYIMGLAADDNGTLWTSWCNYDSGEANMMSLSAAEGAWSSTLGPSTNGTVFMALGTQGGDLIGAPWSWDCTDVKDPSIVGEVRRLTWEGSDYPTFDDYSEPASVPVPALPQLALMLLISLAGFFGARRLR